MGKRTAFLIDGFNVYHFLKQIESGTLLWLDYMSLAKKIALDDEIESVKYFSAFANWDNDKVIRHKIYIKALESSGVQAIMGKFTDKERIAWIKSRRARRTVTFLNETFNAYFRNVYYKEEKKTDVNIGVELYRSVVKDNIEKIVLISNDTDYAPALKIVKEDFPKVAVKVYAPTQNRNLPNDIKRIITSKHHKHLPINFIKSSQFPEEITLDNGTIIHKPDSW